MALTGPLVTLVLLLGADPGLEGDRFGSLREPVPPESVEPGEFPPPIRNVGGWSVGEANPQPLAAAPLPQAAPALAPQQFASKPIPLAAPAAEPNEKPSALKLTPPSKSKTGSAKPAPSATGAVTSVASSLVVVLGLFFALVWLAKRSGPKGAATLPAEVVEVLGRASLAARHQMHVVRFGNKLLLLSIGPTGAETLSEIVEPGEVERLLGICQELQHGSITESFRHVFSQFAAEPAREGFAGAASE